MHVESIRTGKMSTSYPVAVSNRSGGPDPRPGIADVSVKNYFSSFPEESRLKAVFGDAYVINKPMSGVGGDGYWLYKKDDMAFLVVFDCMGHGRFATMMTRFYLRVIYEVIVTREVSDPSQILLEIHAQMEDEFGKKESKQIGTGADMGVLVYDRERRNLKFAGAKMDLIGVFDQEVERIKGNRLSIGEYFEYPRDYRSVLINLEALSQVRLYLYSDGVTDLFGGPKNKRLGFPNLSKMIEDSTSLTFEEEKILMGKSLNSWAGSNDQMDDLLLVGVMIGW